MFSLQDEFSGTAADGRNSLSVLVLGAGVMGQRHIASLREVSEKVLEPRYGIRLNIAAVDKVEERRSGLPAGVAGFATLEEALAAQKPDIALMAFNDDQHAAAFKTLFRECPALKAVLSEKPLTEHLSDAQDIEPELRRRYLSMNTVINFSPVFDRLKEELPKLEKTFGSLKPLGFDAIWGKNRTADTRPSIGVPSEAVHALSVVSDMFGQGSLALESGQARQGYLSVNALDVVYALDATFRSPATGLPMHFNASYVLPEQHRHVTAYYAAADNAVIAVELDFDVKHEGRNADRLRILKIDGASGAVTPLLDEYPDKIASGAAPGLLKNDRITAFISLSLQDFMTPVAARAPEMVSRLSNLDAALQLQGEVEQINARNPLLAVKRVNADPAKLQLPKYPSLTELSGAEVLKRIGALQPARPLLKKQAVPRP